MSRTTAELNAWWAGLIIDELVQTCVTCVCVASGSRSSPLILAAARHPGIQRVHHLDERGLGFFAVGYARATGRAAAIVTTSGTAVANLLPAVCEADASRLPLLVLSADRPPELRHTQANQTLHQPGMFGERVRWFEDMPCPDEVLPDAYVRSTIDQAVYRTRRSPGGPVHLNLMFREPLSGGASGAVESPAGRVHTHYANADDAAVDASDLLDGVVRGLLVIGELADDAERTAAGSVARALGWPVCADVTSGLRFGGLPEDQAVLHYDVILPRDTLTRQIDGIVHLGGRLVSKRLAQALALARPATWIQVAHHPDRHDPDHGVRHRLDCSLAAFAAGLTPLPVSAAWQKDWHTLDHRVEEVLDARLAGSLSEPFVAREVVRALPLEYGLCLGNSMPVRDVLAFAPSVGRSIPVCVNRGVSGIDGTVATAAGFARGRSGPVTLLVGDLSLLHDINALGLLRDAPTPMIVVVINNNGGGIFHFLPVAQEEDIFESCFGTPHGLSFEQAASMYGLAYHAPESPEAFQHAYGEAIHTGRSCLIEVRTDRRENALLHRTLTAQIQEALG